MTRRRYPTTSGPTGKARVAIWVDGALQEGEGEAAIRAVPERLQDPTASVWVDMASPSPDQVASVGALLGLHPLIVEDILEGNQRAKLEITDGIVHVVIFRLDYGERVISIEVDAVLGPGFLLTVHDSAWDPRTAHHLRDGVGAILSHGPDHLLWAIADDIVDAYFPFADRIGDAIDEIQDEVIRSTSKELLEHLFVIKRELIEVRRSIGPVREIFSQITNRELKLIDHEEVLYYRDVYDHVIRLTDELDNYRELAASTLDVYLTQVNNNLSVIMKRLTGVTVILAGIGAVAGIFGMSEAGSAFGGGETSFWAVTGVVVALAVGAAMILRRIDWI